METKLREVKIEEYWPLIVKNTAEFGQIAVAENPEFNNLAECIYRVLCDSFIDADMTEYGVSRWEKMLGITPAEGSSLDDRKAAILTQLSVKIPYTWRVLKQMLVPILGGEDKFVMEYVNDEGKLVIHTDRLDDDMLATVDELLARVLPQNIELVQYNHHIEYSYEEYMKYSTCQNPRDMFKINPDYKDDVTASGVWAFNLDKLNTNYDWSEEYGDKYLFDKSATVKKAIINAPMLSYKGWMSGSLIQEMPNLEELEFRAENGISFYHNIYNCPKLRKLKLHIPKAVNVSDLLAGCNSIEELTITGGLDNVKDANSIANNNRAITKWDIPLPLAETSDWSFSYVNEFKVGLPRVTSLYQSFGGSRLDKESAMRILDSLPADPVTLNQSNESKGYRPGEAWLGIHIDHQQDGEVLAAIANAEAKGWTLTVRWNGTPTSTVGVMRLGQLIYAKVGEGRDGERVLDWGHYVTNEEGYETFRSLESAYKYFNLEMPENE